MLWGQGRWTPYGQYNAGATAATTPGAFAPPPTPFAYKGQWGAYSDERTGLVRMGVRDYAPSLGRFISRDPSGYAGGVNVYGYCAGDPINFFDLTGECAGAVPGAGIGALIGAGAEGFTAYMNGARGAELGWAIARGALKGAISGALIGTLGPGAGACASFGMASGVGAASAMVENIVEQGYKVYDGKQDNFNWKSFFHDGVIGAATGGIMKGLGMLCFDPETPVQVPAKATKVAANAGVASVAGATVLIKSVKAGDRVFARNDKAGKTVIAKVKEVFKRTSDHLITVELASTKGGKVVETLKTTRQHPFYVDGKGWLPAGGLAIGNSIVTRAGPRLFVKSVKWQRRAEGYTVYNFEVEALSGKEADGANTHSYFVGKTSGGAWVHNGKYNDLVRETLSSTKKNLSSAFSVTQDEALDVAEKFLGSGYKEIGLPGSGVFRSADGLRQFRMDANSLLGRHAPNVPHVHMEYYRLGANNSYLNNHIPLIP